MVDFCLRAPDQATMHAIMRGTYELITGSTLDPDAPTPMQGKSLTGTEWVIDDIGLFYEPTGETQPNGMGGEMPVMAPRPGYHVNLRWNGGDEIPPEHPALEIVWRSDAKDENNNPIPRPAWWSRVFA